MNKVYVLYEDLGIPDGLELVAVCDRLEIAQRISNGELWTYDANSYVWTYTQIYKFYDPWTRGHNERKRRFVIDTVIMNDLETA